LVALDRDRDRDDRLARELPAADPATTAASADRTLIDLHDAGEQLLARETIARRSLCSHAHAV
jgi:hypothetical protein